MSGTASTSDARDHARAQASTGILDRPRLPDTVSASEITWTQRIPADSYTTVVFGRGTRIRLGDPEGSACAHLSLLRADAPWERLNVADTVKVPWQAYLSNGHPLLSDQGRVLATVLDDRSGRHDTLCGPTGTARGLLHLAGAKQGLAPRDIGPTVSLFRGVRVEPDGTLTPTGSAGPGATVDLLVHLPVVLLLANAGHPLDDRPATALDLVAWAATAELTEPHSADPEYQRAVTNTEAAWAALTVETSA